MRLWAVYVLAFFAQEFYADFDGKLGEYGTLNAFAFIVGGFASNMLSGAISDRLESGFHKVKSWLCVIQSLIGAGVSCMCFLYTDNFYFSMSSLFLLYLLTEGW